ncbi:uncharacterized protein LOC132640635 [Lycium barbarum]|uniref:uncharacterized protein LOC132640635 n=1 Tax=Lycium barbarum TaxID=112863 RepID=UPI00293EC852|nr:uncharacterized protein LOC132640635 [Lycium barbarum]XP_060213313.1 uncharacterized protein LOC132640635 [Lycium barbarum]XP_060213341.1 uncharacterized protein LOC132640635 [Lycium barbarum]XP_060213347.1 uncharacterized protein LOC132640635 [Lycium barbarum]
MKLSLKLQEQPQSLNNHQKQPQSNPLLIRAKIPISIFNLPFLSCFSTTTHHPSDLSLSLATCFPSGPTLKLAYSTNPTTPPNPTTPTALPLTLTLKSGIGVFGSTKNSPLVISANFNFSPVQPYQNPTFTLLFKPQLGSFSLRKSTTSDLNCGSSGVDKQNGDGNSLGFVPLERPMSFKDFSMEDYAKDSVFKGIAVMAKTEMPLTKRVMMDCRWGVNFPKDLGNRMPFLNVNKIGIKRVDEVKEVKEKKDDSLGDTELLKGMCFWMKKELEMLQRENREMKHRLDEMNMGNVARKNVNEGEFLGGQVAENSGGFEQWRNKKNSGGENGKKEVKKNTASNGNRASDVESELQKAIKAASST